MSWSVRWPDDLGNGVDPSAARGRFDARDVVTWHADGRRLAILVPDDINGLDAAGTRNELTERVRQSILNHPGTAPDPNSG